MTPRARDSLAHAIAHPYWLDSDAEAPRFQRLSGDLQCDLAVVGAGYTGLWSALQARLRYPERRIVVIDAGPAGGAASGRNGGFCAPSISHGVSNALKRWPDEAEQLIQLGRQNLDELQQDIDRFDLKVEFERQGKLNVASTPWQIDGLKALAQKYHRFGIDCQYLEGEALHSHLKSSTYSAGLFESNYALLNPVKMVRELLRVCLEQGIEVYQYSPVDKIHDEHPLLRLDSGYGQVRAKQVILATNAFTSLLPRLKSSVIPIYDYALTTEPLSHEQLNAIGWLGRYGIADSGNQFHYLRKTADNRILWGGFDAIYPFASRLDESLTQRPETFLRLAEQFQQCFPQLAEVNFSHAWGGIIDSSARTTMFTGRAYDGRLAYALGFTGQGVAATRFAALTLLDLLEGKDSPRTALRMLSQKPFPFPPEPLRYAAVSLAQRGLVAEDQDGKRSLFLKTLDAFGVGFDS